jgi:WD40 repeat protein
MSTAQPTSCPWSPAAQDALLQRCFAAEQLRCVAASPDGALVAAGGASGRVYLWQAGSGRLLRSWPAHYRVRAAVENVLTAARHWIALLVNFNGGAALLSASFGV